MDKFDIFSRHNEKIFECKPDFRHVSRTVIDLHTELLYDFQRMSLKVAVTPVMLSDNYTLTEIDFNKEFEGVYRKCKNNKIAQALLLLCKALNLHQELVIGIHFFDII